MSLARLGAQGRIHSKKQTCNHAGVSLSQADTLERFQVKHRIQSWQETFRVHVICDGLSGVHLSGGVSDPLCHAISLFTPGPNAGRMQSLLD